MGAQNHEKIDGVYLRRQLSKLSREVLRTISTITIPTYKLPQAPHSSVISIDSAGGTTPTSRDCKPALKTGAKFLGKSSSGKALLLLDHRTSPLSPDSP